MKNLFLILLIICFGCSSTKNVQEAFIDRDIYRVDIEQPQVELIANTLSQFLNNSEIAIALVHSNKLIFYGLQRTNDSIRIANNSNQVFEIGSITKVFTTQLLINLLEEGKIKNLDESVIPHLDFKIKGNPNITFRQLANHTSGLPSNLNGSIFNTDVRNPYKNWNKEKLVEYFSKDVKLDSEPGVKYQYSNVGMALLAYTISKIEEEKYESLLQKNIFKPLEMKQSTTDRYLVQDYLVQGYNWKGKPTANWEMAEMKGAGAVLSTTNDLSKFVMWNFSALKNQLKLMSQSAKVINDNLEIALGWHIIKNKTSNPFLWHNAGTGGYKSSMAINLYNDTGVIVLTNIGATDNPKKGLIDNLCFDLMKSLEK
jgi:CubicO group peptidase (beta-lactamase class C family)